MRSGKSTIVRTFRVLLIALVALMMTPLASYAEGAVLCIQFAGHVALESDCEPVDCCADEQTSGQQDCLDIALPNMNAVVTKLKVQHLTVDAPAHAGRTVNVEVIAPEPHRCDPRYHPNAGPPPAMLRSVILTI